MGIGDAWSAPLALSRAGALVADYYSWSILQNPCPAPAPDASLPPGLQGIRTLVLTNATGQLLAREQAQGRRFNEVWQHFPDVPGFGVQQRAGDPRAAVAPALALSALRANFSWVLYGDVSAPLGVGQGNLHQALGAAGRQGGPALCMHGWSCGTAAIMGLTKMGGAAPIAHQALGVLSARPRACPCRTMSPSSGLACCGQCSASALETPTS